jgi:hypothetical protein
MSERPKFRMRRRRHRIKRSPPHADADAALGFARQRRETCRSKPDG